MDNRILEAYASNTPPTPPGLPSTGFPTKGNPATGTPATVPGEYFFYQLGEEIRNVILAAGLTPNHTQLNQLTSAIQSIASTNDALRRTVTTAQTVAGPVSFSKNVGVGGPPYPWLEGTGKMIDFGSGASVGTNPSNGAGIVMVNAYLDSTNTFRYKTNGPASSFTQINGVCSWWAAPSGTANAAVTFTQVMALDASGNLAAVGNVSSNGTNLVNPTQNNTFTKGQRGAVLALTDAATIAVDLSLSNNYSITLAGNRILGNPTNVVPGQSGVIAIIQDATGGRTLAFGSNYKFARGSAPTLTTTSAAVDQFAYYVDTPTRIIFVAAAKDSR